MTIAHEGPADDEPEDSIDQEVAEEQPDTVEDVSAGAAPHATIQSRSVGDTRKP